MINSPPCRTNLWNSKLHDVDPEWDKLIGEGAFRTVYSGIYRGGGRNTQQAVCKIFKDEGGKKKEYVDDSVAKEWFEADKEVTRLCLAFADEWNQICQKGWEITVNRGDVKRMWFTTKDQITGEDYSSFKSVLVEPFIRDFCKYTSNNGYINRKHKHVQRLVLEAFSHFTYHLSSGTLLVCDLQGHRRKAINGKTSRFELTDLAICSRSAAYGPTDLGEKGIDSFFANHKCNKFCSIGHVNGIDSSSSGNIGSVFQGIGFGPVEPPAWIIPYHPKQWFPKRPSSTMLSSAMNEHLSLTSKVRFKEHPIEMGQLEMVQEGDEYSDNDDDDDDDDRTVDNDDDDDDDDEEEEEKQMEEEGKPTKVCRYFASKGYCWFGDKCRFLHHHQLDFDFCDGSDKENEIGSDKDALNMEDEEEMDIDSKDCDGDEIDSYQTVCWCVLSCCSRKKARFEGWTPDAGVNALYFQKASVADIDINYKQVRDVAVHQGFIERGRRSITGLGPDNVVLLDHEGRPPFGVPVQHLSGEMYVRLTAIGMKVAEGSVFSQN